MRLASLHSYRITGKRTRSLPAYYKLKNVLKPCKSAIIQTSEACVHFVAAPCKVSGRAACLAAGCMPTMTT
eukprot:1469178-Pleurochrysis_carterae.AAC.1